MTDLDTYLPLSGEQCRVMFDVVIIGRNPRDGINITGIFRVRDDSEIAYSSLSREDRDAVMEACIYAVEQRNKLK